VSKHGGALDEYAAELNSVVIDEIRGWKGHPELGRILGNLRSHTNRKAFFDTLAEATVARHLLARGCRLRFEVPTPLGRRCDFEVKAPQEGGPERTFYLHVKRLDSDRPVRHPRQLMAVTSRLRVLERIARPYIVQVRWHEGLSAQQMQRLVTQAGEFILQARVGEEMISRDHDGRELGGVRIIAPWEGTHVNVTIGLPPGFVDQAPRFRRLAQRAYQQFMPRAVNVIMICSGQVDDEGDFETALLGSHIERWDAYPPRGKRVAHGRANDGFWHGQRFSASKFAGWFCLAPDQAEARMRLWARDNMPIDTEVQDWLTRVLEGERL